jgi:hypothetical protein
MDLPPNWRIAEQDELGRALVGVVRDLPACGALAKASGFPR